MAQKFEKYTKYMKYEKLVAWIFILILLGITIASYVYANSRIEEVKSELATLTAQHASSTAVLESRINDTREELASVLENQEKNLEDVADRLRDYRRQVGDVSETVETLQKISQTDPELLAKYSKIFFLNENYAPARLVEIPKEYRYSDLKALKIHDRIWPFLETMMDEAKSDGITMYVSSAYRSFNEQQALKGQYTTVYGAGTANQFSADQGYSEHQLGTTVDFTAPGLGGGLDGFDKTPAFPWLQKNAHQFGFILSYPANNGFYVYEPWHWRFVGVELATYLYKQKKNFYDLDQRDIDEYLANLFDE